MRGRCDNPRCAKPFGCAPPDRHTHWGKCFCSLECKKAYRHDLRQRRRERKAVRVLFRIPGSPP